MIRNLLARLTLAEGLLLSAVLALSVGVAYWLLLL